MFRFKQGVKRGYDEQGYIYFVSRLYHQLPVKKQRLILDTCVKCGGEHYKALFEFVTTDVSATELTMKYFISRSTLERVVRKYYQSFPIEK